jgi:glycosyltransferase involved in cell wall biosynthesis
MAPMIDVSSEARARTDDRGSSPADVSIVIPTQRRPQQLLRAARSALRQTGVDRRVLELVIADNDQTPSARPIAEQLAAEARFPVVYVHEPRPGVANVRNAAMTAAGGGLIAFLDDDEEAPDGWLAALLDVQLRFDADVVFGPVRARAPDHVVEHRAYLERFFSRVGPAEAGLSADYYGCGDSLVRRAALPDLRRPFSEVRNQTGGEDDLLFGAMKARGARFAWAPAAYVFEDPAPERLSLGYAIRRAFAYGHGPTSHCAASDPPDRLGVARWMAIGLGQAVVYGLAALGQWIVRAPDRAFSLDKAARGLGKTLWWGPFRVAFYGRPAPQPAA